MFFAWKFHCFEDFLFVCWNFDFVILHGSMLGTTITINLISGKGTIVEFPPHQVIIKDFKYPKHVLETRIVNNINRLYRFNKFGSSWFPLIFISHNDDLRKISHKQFGHLNY